jgi:hypothetical protein
LRKREDIPAAAETVITKELSVRATEELVKSMNIAAEQAEAPVVETPKAVDYLAVLTKKMTEKLGRRVQIAGTKKNPKLVISYTDNQDLQALVELLCGKDILDA